MREMGGGVEEKSGTEPHFAPSPLPPLLPAGLRSSPPAPTALAT